MLLALRRPRPGDAGTALVLVHAGHDFAGHAVEGVEAHYLLERRASSGCWRAPPGPTRTGRAAAGWPRATSAGGARRGRDGAAVVARPRRYAAGSVAAAGLGDPLVAAQPARR